MLKLAQIAKLAKGSLGPDEIGELLASAGIDLQMIPVEREKGPVAFRGMAIAASKPGARLVAMRGLLKNGESMEALLVLVPSQIPTKG